MKWTRVLAIARKTLRSLKHDRRTVGFLVLMPLFMITIFGYTFGGSIKDVSVVVVNLDESDGNSSAAEAVLAELRAGGILKVERVYLLDPETDGYLGATDQAALVGSAVSEVESGDAWAAIVFWGNFTENVAQSVEDIGSVPTGGPGTITVYIDASNSNIAQAVMGEVRLTVQEVVVSEYHVLPPITVAEDRVYGEGAEFIDFFAPGVMGLAAMMVTFMLSIISFVHERSTGTLDRLLTTPATEGEIVAGYALALGLVGLIQSTVILVTAVALFQVQIVGSPLLVLLIIFVLGAGNQGLGFLLSSNAKNEFQAVQFMPIILFPSILLAGVFWPIEAVPDLLRPVSYFVPLTYAVEGCRSVMVRGWGLGDVWLQLAVLVGFAAVMLLLSALSLKKRR
ncbi:MAG: transporter permease [Candidatus Thermoplasmatota archaeon]|nr:transporter permease [Candidatus Thermoplasmatota archaeon]